MSGERRSASRARARVVGQSRGVGEVQTRKTFLLSLPRLGTDRRTPTREDGFFLSSRDESSRRSASSASRDAPSSPRSPSSTSPSVGPCPRPSRTRTRCSFRHTLRSAGATGRANKCRFLPTATRDGSRRDAPREALGGARRDGVRSHERHRRSRAHREPSAIRGHARDRRDRAVCGVRDRPRAFLVRERPLHRPRKLPGTTQKPGDARTRGARFGKADATSSRQFPGFRLAISSRVSQRFSPLLLCFAKTGKALTRFSEDLTRSRI